MADGVAPLDGGDAVSRLRWGIRRYRWALVVVVAAVTALVVGFTQRLPEQPYQATALVVARHLNVSVEQLPRFGEAVFNSPAVSRLAIEDGNLALTPEALIPGKVTIEPVQDTVLFRVQAEDDDPLQAATLANVTAAAFIEELNKPGDGVGEFALQSEAPAPDERLPAPISPVEGAAVGLLAGLTTALGGLWLLLVLRPPVMSGPQAAALAGAPLVGTLTLPSTRAALADLDDIGGLRLTARRLFPFEKGVCAFLACKGAEAACRRVTTLLGRLFERRGVPTVVPATAAGASWDAPEPGGVTLFDVPSLSSSNDLPEVVPPDARLVLVVQEGSKASAVTEAAGPFVPGELDGALFVRSRRPGRRRPALLLGWRRRRHPRLAGDRRPLPA